jgi:Tfp pilus assembly protein PilV
MGFGKTRQNGMTLIEAVLALLITLLLITGLTQLFLLGPVNTKTANHKVSSLNLAQAKIEQLKSLGYAGIVTANYSPQQEAVVIDTVKPDDSSDDLNGIRATIVTNITNGKKIVVDVTWTEFNRQFTESAETVIYKLD